MPERTETFEILESPMHAAKIKVVGVGGAGGNAVEHMINRNVNGVAYYCANTDAQALGLLSAANKIQLGSKITRGLGAGGDPEQGRAAALEDRDQIREILQDADMVFIAAGMGGGTGTGAAPVIAEVARELGVLTVAIVNRPFPFEKQKRIAMAEKGIVDLAEHVDSLIIVPNAKLLEVLPPDTTVIKAFEAANDVLQDAVKGISDIINRPGLINVDFADVKTVMSKRGHGHDGHRHRLARRFQSRRRRRPRSDFRPLAGEYRYRQRRRHSDKCFRRRISEPQRPDRRGRGDPGGLRSR